MSTVGRQRSARSGRMNPMARCLAVAATVVLVASGCSGSGDAAVTAAQASVTAKEKALADAQAAETAAEAGFCQASADYIVALDRYADVLVDTAPTVGDVTTAGRDLTDPREETVAAAEGVGGAREAVAKAEQDLAEAQAALAAAEAKAAGESAPEPEESEGSAAPTAPPASVTRVQKAEAEFAAAQSGISDSTPLVQASVQFNAAAVALQMSWLALFAESGCLTDAQQEQAEQAVRDYTKALQQDLADAGYYEGEVDGVYGPETVAAVQSLQEANGLPQTGALDKATEAALRSELAAAGGIAAQEAMASTAALQQTLKLAGYWDGPVDGQWSDELTEALKKFQEDLGVEPTGTVDAATIAAFEEALTALMSPAPSPSSESPTPSPSDSAQGEPSEAASPTA